MTDELRPINPLALLGFYALAAVTPASRKRAPGRRRADVRRRRRQAPAFTIRPADAPEQPAVADTREDN